MKISDEEISKSASSGLPRLANLRNQKLDSYIPGRYKYVIVPNGLAGRSTSSR